MRIPSGSDPVVTIDVMDRRLYEGSASQLMAEKPDWFWWLLLILEALLVLAIVLWLIRRPASP